MKRSTSRIIALLTFLAIFLIPYVSFLPASAVVSVAAPSFVTPYNLSRDSGTARAPNVQVIGSHVYVSWSEGGRGIFFRESPDGGATWVPPLSISALRISIAGGASQFPLVSPSGSNVYVVWSQTVGTTGLQVFVATSTNFGASFNRAVQVTSGTTSNGHITPVIVSSGSHVYVSYLAGDSTYVSGSSDNGAHWSTPFAFGLREPQLAISGQYVYGTSVGGSVYSSDSGNHWAKILENCCGSEPWVWASGPNSYITWETKGSQSLVYERHTNNNGGTWSSKFLLSSTLPNSWNPMVWAYGNRAWIAMQEYPGGSNDKIFVYTTANAGRSWSSPVRLSDGSPTSYPFTVSSSDGFNIFVGWSQRTSTSPTTWVFRVAYSGDGGTTWTASPGINVSRNPAGTLAGDNNDVANGAIAANGTHCYAVWLYISGTSRQIYFTHS